MDSRIVRASKDKSRLSIGTSWSPLACMVRHCLVSAILHEECEKAADIGHPSKDASDIYQLLLPLDCRLLQEGAVY